MINSTKIKKAISFSGQPRFVLNGYRTLKQNLAGFEDYDVFIHTWEAPENEHEKCLVYEPKLFVAEPQQNVIPEGVRSDPFFQRQDVFVHFSMFYSMMRSLLLKQEWEKLNGFVYDLVIRTRFDISLETYIDPATFSFNEGVFSPDVCGNEDAQSDWFNFSNSKLIDLYAEIYGKMVEFSALGVRITAGENIIKYWLDVNNVERFKIPCNLYLLKRIGEFIPPNVFWKYGAA
jgi:hypothetical protein